MTTPSSPMPFGSEMRWAQSNTQFWQGAWNGSAVGGAYKSWSLLQPDNLLNQDCGTTSALGVWTDEACATTLGELGATRRRRR